MEDGFAAFERLATTAELRSVFVVGVTGQEFGSGFQIQTIANLQINCYFIKFLDILPNSQLKKANEFCLRLMS